MITEVGKINIPMHVTNMADTMKLKNYKVDSPAKFDIQPFSYVDITEQLSLIIGVRRH